MTEFCINTESKLIPNTIELGKMLNENMEYVDVAILCIAEITKEEYLNFVKERNLMHRVRPNIDKMNFYLIQILD